MNWHWPSELTLPQWPWLEPWKARWAALDEPSRRGARTAFVVFLAVVAFWLLWRHYMVAPWTRDGRVRAEVVKIAPEVSGTVAEVRVVDNQFVHKGDILFVIDPVRFRLALAQAEAVVAQRGADLKAKNYQAVRRVDLLKISAVSQDEQQQFQGAADIAAGAGAQAEADRDLAKLNLERSILRAPVNGYVTNLNLRVGDFAATGQTQLSIVDSDSFYVLGYFEETKLRNVRDRARAQIRLMQGGPALDGYVESVSRGITDLNAQPDGEGLANVDPVFTWVRLAQRIPVRIHISHIPDGVRVVSGLTCTVTVDEWRKPLPQEEAPPEQPPAPVQP